MAGRMFDLIAFDGDDTLWHNERVYRMGRERFAKVLARAGVRRSDEDVERLVSQTELANLKYYGYGVTSFVMSLIEAAVELTDGRISGTDVLEFLQLAKEMLTARVELFDGAAEAVGALAETYPLMLITKGDLLHQRAKAEESGLGQHFRAIEVVSTKTRDTYSSILARCRVEPSRFLMVGNSLRSDVLPVLEIGGWAVHVPAPLSWAHEDGDPPDAATSRFFELGSLRSLPALVGGLSTDRSA